MILNLRGSHGSGKTWVSHQLILNNNYEAVVDPEWCREKHFVKPNCHKIEGGVNVVGRWKSGMDGIFPQEIIEDMLEYWAPQGNVVWENVMISANVGRWCVLAKKLESVNHSIWAFFDTPLDVCIERVFNRREESAERGFSHRQENADVKLDVLAGHWRRCRRAATRAFQDGIDVRWINHEYSYEQIHNLLVLEGGWDKPLKDSDGLFVSPERWTPTEEEQQLVFKTARLPWEPEDTKTKVNYVSVSKRVLASKHEGLGMTVRKWGAGLEDTEEFGTTVRSWKAATESTLLQGPVTLLGESS